MAKSTSADRQTIFALRDCYLDELRVGDALAGDAVFRLNSFEVDRSLFKLAQELAMLQLTEDRLGEQYINTLVLEPMRAAVELARSDISAAEEELRAEQARFEVGEATRADVLMAEGRLAGRRIILLKGEIDLGQRKVEIDTQRRRLSAAETDLSNRGQLNMKIRELYEYHMPFAGSIEPHSYGGAFVEEGDPICTILRK
ncbi:hypothetical protein GOD00_30850 [Sinorhizobium medicae]|nr:hypothetical protein [Sinorhizobium medicae]